jgi:hypothetical protein
MARSSPRRLAVDPDPTDEVDAGSWATFVQRGDAATYDFEFNHVLEYAYEY